MNTGKLVRLLILAATPWIGCTDTITGGGGSTPAAKPTAPVNLAGTLQSGGAEIALSWTHTASDENGFRIEINSSPFGTPPYVGVFFVPTNATSYVYSTQANTTYYFRVYAITGSAQSDPSNEIIMTTPNFPAPPYYFSALATGPTEIDVRWWNGPGVQGNTVQWSIDGMSWNNLFSSPTGENQVVGATHSGLSPSTVYYYRGFASSAAGSSGPTPVASSRTQTTPGGITVVDPNGVGVHSSLSFGAGANQNIISYDFWSSRVVITRGGFGGPYSTFPVATGQGNGLNGVSGVVDNAGYYFAASHLGNFSEDELQFSTNEGGSSSVITLESDTMSAYDFVGKDPDLRLSPADGSIHIIYKIESGPTGDGYLKHAWRPKLPIGSGWTIETFLGYEPVLRGHSFAIDGSGVLHVIYSTQIAGVYQIRHARKSGNTWTFETIASQGQPAMNSVAVGAGNALHVAWKDDTVGALMVATNASGAWMFEEVHRHTTDNLGRHNSITVWAGNVHVSYYDVSHGNLWYATRPEGGGTWDKRLVDSAGDVGRFTSIASDGADLYISYYDFTNEALKMIRNPQN